MEKLLILIECKMWIFFLLNPYCVFSWLFTLLDPKCNLFLWMVLFFPDSCSCQRWWGTIPLQYFSGDCDHAEKLPESYLEGAQLQQDGGREPRSGDSHSHGQCHGCRPSGKHRLKWGWFVKFIKAVLDQVTIILEDNYYRNLYFIYWYMAFLYNGLPT